MFFDRLGDPADVPLIESMAVRLMAGQGAQGGWSYTCPAIGQAEAVRLTKLLRQRSELKGQKTLPPGGPQQGRRDPRQLTPEINQQLLAIARQAAVALDGGIGDNSNTQFATLGLWVARRHGLPVDRALQLVDQRFRGSQNADGGWSYVPMGRMPGPRPPMMGPGNGSTPAMTCAGLLGLAVHHGAVNDKAKEKGGRPARDPGNDAVVQAGLRALGTCIGKPQGNVGQAQAFSVPMIGQGRGGRAYYFLWSLERVAVAYGLDTIGGKDWYNWGAEILLANQAQDGGWYGEYSPGGCDTCFALLFLRRANLAKDLTANLKGKVKDVVQLRSGGVGGGGLKGIPSLRPAIDPNEKTSPTSTVPEKEQVKPPPVVPGSAKGGDDPVARLEAKLVDAPPARRDKVLEELRDGKGGEYTQALAGAIYKLDGADRKKAREALAERLSGLKTTTLARYLDCDDPELRRAASLALAMKEDKSQLARIIDLLDDPEVSVQRAAYASLKSLTGKDFGPAAKASRAEHARAVAAWREWLKKNAR